LILYKIPFFYPPLGGLLYDAVEEQHTSEDKQLRALRAAYFHLVDPVCLPLVAAAILRCHYISGTSVFLPSKVRNIPE